MARRLKALRLKTSKSANVSPNNRLSWPVYSDVIPPEGRRSATHRPEWNVIQARQRAGFAYGDPAPAPVDHSDQQH